ncbi:transporter DMT superfamily protein [Caballeronia fortuita]|uniref:Transporter DMT superfamily protein n=1 Tax=Caballeronia fortuita TaxID=1777138 RepID=A0A158BHC8_9BURK|nr:EamA family transporter RarD [Caballeronia fortuita]SAK69176.1 transporter DMT superfamily protein [Caballeronia fortuita]
MNQHELARGIALSVAASTLFALMSGYTKWLAPLDGLDIFAWRIVWTLPGALALVVARKRWPQLCALVARLAKTPRLLLLSAIEAALLGVQLWIFLWAPLHGRALEVSLGYFLLPLAMVLLGRFHYGERLDGFQWAGVAAAAIGVAHELIVTHAFAWPTLVVMLGYPPYFMLRRRLNADPLVSFAVEIMLMSPVAVVMLFMRGAVAEVASQPHLWLLLAGLGALSTIALASYLRASRHLPLALFGILGYVEPVLLVGVAVLLLGEPFSTRQLGTYVPIWIAVALTGVHSARLVMRERSRKQTMPMSEHHASAEHETVAEEIERVD